MKIHTRPYKARPRKLFPLLPKIEPLRYQAQIAQAIPDALRQGPKGWEITDCRITLVDGNSHVYHTHPLDFITTTQWPS